MRDRSLAMIKHQERTVTKLGTAWGGLLRSTNHVRDRRAKPCLAGTAILQPSKDLLEYHCCQGQYFDSIRAVFWATIYFLLDNHAVVFPSVSQEQRARCDLGRAAGCTGHFSSMPAAGYERWEGGALNAV
ncbi:hypothetical protein MRX96_020015 [Rhipicephalus microplus]